MYTTIKVSEELKEKLTRMKTRDSESYEDIIDDLIEDHLSLNPKFKKSLEKARAGIKKGEFVEFPELRKGLE